MWPKRGKAKRKIPKSAVPIRKVYVRNIAFGTRKAELKNLFNNFGRVEEVHIRGSGEDDWEKVYYAFITFERVEDANRALAAPKSELKLREQVLHVYVAHNQLAKQDEQKITAKQKYTCHVDRKDELENYEPEDDGYLNRKRCCKITDLNNDCLHHIFSYLEVKEKISLELVCKRWRVLLLDQWSRVIHFDFQNLHKVTSITDDILGTILQRCGMSLLRLDLPISHRLTGDAMHVIATLCKRLQHLSAHKLHVTTSAINQFANECKHVISLILRKPKCITDRDIQILFEKLPLESFCLTERYIYGLCLSGLPCTLKHLDLTSCKELMMSSLLSGLSQTTSLNSLVLHRCPNLTKTDFELMCSKIPFIQVLNVTGYFQNSSDLTLNSITQLENLRKLDLNLNELVDDHLITLISTNCRKLEVLDISGCRGNSLSSGVTDIGIKAIAQNTNITNLSMSYLYKVSDESLFALADAGKLKQLYCLGCPGITDNGCSRLLSLCLELELLDLSGCNNISCETTNMAVKTLSLRPDAKKLYLIVTGTKVAAADLPVPNSSLKVDMSINSATRDDDFLDYNSSSSEEYYQYSYDSCGTYSS